MDVKFHSARFLLSFFSGLALQGCGGGGSDDGAASVDGEADIDVEFSGSVGDGPVVNAQLTVRAKSGDVLQQRGRQPNRRIQRRAEDQGEILPARRRRKRRHGLSHEPASGFRVDERGD